jgi:glycosyltransferase 2 family protein
MKIKISKKVRLVIKIVITIGALYYVYTKIDPEEMIGILKKANIGLLFVALLLFIVSKFISSIRLNHFLRRINIFISHKYNIKLYLLGMFYNMFLPGGIGGDGYKIYLLNKRFQVKTARIFWAILFDRVSGLVALFGLSVIFVYFTGKTIPFKDLIWILLPLSLVAFFISMRFIYREFQKIYTSTMLMSFSVQISQVITALAILYAIGIPDSIFEYLFVFLISSIVAALPVSIGGVGSREVTFLFGAEYLHLDINASVALSLMFYFITLIVSLSGIYYNLYPEKLK